MNRPIAWTVTLLATVAAPLLAEPTERRESPSAAAAETALRTSRHFAFHSDPWVNLHHFLYHEARNALLREKRLRGRVRIAAEDRAVRSTLGEEESATLASALRAYADLGELSFFDETMVAIGNAAMGGPDAFPEKGAAAAATAALRRAMPIYRRHWWPRHDAANRARIDDILGRLRGVEEPLAQRLAAAYERAWPPAPVRVDLTAYSGRSGAYAFGPPNRIVLTSGAEWFPGNHVIDILFHEVGHTHPFADAVYNGSHEAARAAGVDEGRLWHSFLFVVPSQAAREVMPDGHVPYAYAEGGPMVDGRMAAHGPVIERALSEGKSLDETFALIHRARAAASDGE